MCDDSATGIAGEIDEGVALVVFLEARYDEQEAEAVAIDDQDRLVRVLVSKALLDMHRDVLTECFPCETLFLMAQEFTWHPEFRERWRRSLARQPA